MEVEEWNSFEESEDLNEESSTRSNLFFLPMLDPVRVEESVQLVVFSSSSLCVDVSFRTE